MSKTVESQVNQWVTEKNLYITDADRAPLPCRPIRVPTKTKLLDHYANHEPTLFIQYNANDKKRGDGPYDEYIAVDIDETFELMREHDLCVLIKPSLDLERALNLLEAVKRSVEKALHRSGGWVGKEDGAPCPFPT
jgi:hypothetical protein